MADDLRVKVSDLKAQHVKSGGSISGFCLVVTQEAFDWELKSPGRKFENRILAAAGVENMMIGTVPIVISSNVNMSEDMDDARIVSIENVINNKTDYKLRVFQEFFVRDHSEEFGYALVRRRPGMRYVDSDRDYPPREEIILISKNWRLLRMISDRLNDGTLEIRP